MPNALHDFLGPTPTLDFHHPEIERLVSGRRWQEQPPTLRVQAIHDFVRDEIPFGCNESDGVPASKVLSDGYGWCNTKTTLVMALLRAAGLPTRFRAGTVHKELQRGAIPVLLMKLVPEQLIHSWRRSSLRIAASHFFTFMASRKEAKPNHPRPDPRRI